MPETDEPAAMLRAVQRSRKPARPALTELAPHLEARHLQKQQELSNDMAAQGMKGGWRVAKNYCRKVWDVSSSSQ